MLLRLLLHLALRIFLFCNLPSRILSTASKAFLGSTSVKNPRSPMFIAKIGGSGLDTLMHVRSIVPSPPIVIKKSGFIFERGTIFSCVLIFPAKRIFNVNFQSFLFKILR